MRACSFFPAFMTSASVVDKKGNIVKSHAILTTGNMVSGVPNIKEKALRLFGYGCPFDFQWFQGKKMAQGEISAL